MSVDTALLDRWKKTGDAEAFAEIVSRYSGLVFATARRILRNRMDAEDVTQECFIRLARGDVRIRTSLPGWLHALATHRALDRIRSESSRRRREAENGAPSGSTIPGAEWREIETIIDEEIAELPDLLREPLVQHFFMGRTHDSIAAELAVSRPAVTQRMQRAVEELRKRLGRRGVSVMVGSVAAFLLAQHADAVPHTLAVSLAKLALLGPPKTVGTVVGGWMAGGAGVKLAAGLGVAAFLALGVIAGPGLWQRATGTGPEGAAVIMGNEQKPPEPEPALEEIQPASPVQRLPERQAFPGG